MNDGLQIVPVERSFIELTSELARLAEAMNQLPAEASVAMARYVNALAAPQFLIREEPATKPAAHFPGGIR